MPLWVSIGVQLVVQFEQSTAAVASSSYFFWPFTHDDMDSFVDFSQQSLWFNLLLFALPILSYIEHYTLFRCNKPLDLAGPNVVCQLELDWNDSRKDLSSNSIQLFYPSSRKNLKPKSLLFSSFLNSRDFVEFSSKYLGIPKFFLGALNSRMSHSVPAFNHCSNIECFEPLMLSDTISSFPVALVLSGGNPNLHLWLCESLSSRGWVVIAISNDSSTKYSRFLDHKCSSEIVERNSKQGEEREEFIYKSNVEVQTRSREISWIIDRLTAIHYGNSFNPYSLEDETELVEERLLGGKLDLQRLAIIGQGFNAATALYALSFDRRIKAAVCYDSWLSPVLNELTNGLPSPALFMEPQVCFDLNSTANPVLKQQIGQVRKIVSNSSGSFLFKCIGATSTSFTDYSFLTPILLRLWGKSSRIWHNMKIDSENSTAKDKHEMNNIQFYQAVERYTWEFLETSLPDRSTRRMSSFDRSVRPNSADRSASSTHQLGKHSSSRNKSNFPALVFSDLKLECVGW